MKTSYALDTWHDSPAGFRSSLPRVNPSSWVPIEDALKRCASACRSDPSFAHRMLVWWLQNGLIAAKSEVVEVRYSDDSGACRYHEMPVDVEWRRDAWASLNSEVWSKGIIRTVENLPGSHMRCHYLGIGVDVEGLDRLADHLSQLSEPPSKSKPKLPPPEAAWAAWVSERKAAASVMPSQEKLHAEAREKFPKNRVTQHMIRAAFRGGKQGPRSKSVGK